MEISIEKLKFNSEQKQYNSGYRIVYFYDNHHEILKNVCANDIYGLAEYCKLKNKEKITIEAILDAFLNLNKKAQAVAIYDVETGKEIKRQHQNNKKTAKDYVLFKEELMYDYGVENFIDGYRIVYFYPNSEYSVGAFSKSIEGFMFEFCDMYPIDNESNIPKFISIEDILDRSLNMWSDIESVAIYKTDGTCIMKKERTKRK